MKKFEIYISKSSLMLYDRCPQKFKRIMIDNVQVVKSPIMMQGTVFHNKRSDYLASVNEFKFTSDFNENFEYIRSLLPESNNIIYDNIAITEAKRSLEVHPTLFCPVMTERKFKTVFCDVEFSNDYPEKTVSNIQNIMSIEHLEKLKQEYGISPVITMKGKIDDLFLREDGSYTVHEFKTGIGVFNSNKQTKIRKELILYKFLLEPHLVAPIDYISYHFAASNKYIEEKIQKRSITAFRSLMYRLTKSILDNQFEIKYFDKACDGNCQFSKDCRLMRIGRTKYV